MKFLGNKKKKKKKKKDKISFIFYTIILNLTKKIFKLYY